MLNRSAKPLVLVADDDATTRYLFCETLTHEGFLVIEAANGDEAVELWREQQPDVVLLDVEMPVQDGYEACARILRAGGLLAPPVVMVTAHDDRESIDRAFDLGATDFIAKPISWPLLGHRLRYILRGSRNLRDLCATLDENRALLAAFPDHLLIFDDNGVVNEHLHGDGSPSFGALGDPVGTKIDGMFPAELRDRALLQAKSSSSDGCTAAIEFQMSGLKGEGNWRECRFTKHSDNRYLAIVRDISERKGAEARVHRLAYFDSLTGLPNRTHFSDILQTTIDRGETPVVVLTIDLDRFKRINDTLGMAVGDETLVKISLRLQRELNDKCSDLGLKSAADPCLARLGGNAFAVMLAGNYQRSDLIPLAERLGRAVERPMRLRGHEFVITASIGVAYSPIHGESVESLLKKSEAARFDAKARGSNSQRLYRSSMSPCHADCLDLETSFRRSLERGELDVVYQPKFLSEDRTLVGAEALLRWNHPDRGWISPQTFIPIAEDAGLTPALGAWVANRVCRQIARWQRAGYDVVPVALNVSAQEFVHGEVLDTLLRATRAVNISPSLVELELTESMLMSDISSVVTTLHGIRDAGFGIAVDDFGTGYSSLRYLHRFPVSTLKVDYSFVRDVEDNPESRAICSTIIALGHSLGLSVVGEGVETRWQQAFLQREKCDVLQGFRLGRPQPASQFASLLPQLASNRSRPVSIERPRLYCVES